MSVSAYHVPKYSVGMTEKVVGAPAGDPIHYTDGFIFYNISSGECFVVSGGVWTLTSIPAVITAVWNI